VDRGFPHVVFSADEAIELLESLTRWPTGLWTRCRGLTTRRFMPLTKGRCVVAIEAQDLCNRNGVIRHDRRVARVARGDLRNRTRVHLVVITAGFQCRPRRRTESCGVELVVAKSVFGEFLGRRHVHRTAKGRWCRIAHIVQQDDHHIGCISRCFHFPLWGQRHLRRQHLGHLFRLRLCDREMHSVEFSLRRLALIRTRRGHRSKDDDTTADCDLTQLHERRRETCSSPHLADQTLENPVTTVRKPMKQLASFIRRLASELFQKAKVTGV